MYDTWYNKSSLPPASAGAVHAKWRVEVVFPMTVKFLGALGGPTCAVPSDLIPWHMQYIEKTLP